MCLIELNLSSSFSLTLALCRFLLGSLPFSTFYSLSLSLSLSFSLIFFINFSINVSFNISFEFPLPIIIYLSTVSLINYIFFSHYYSSSSHLFPISGPVSSLMSTYVFVISTLFYSIRSQVSRSRTIWSS